MRYTTTQYLKDGMLLGMNIYDENFNIKFKQGLKLKGKVIDTIKKLGYTGIYVIDDQSEGVMPKNLIREETYMNAVRETKEIMEAIQRNKPDLKKWSKLTFVTDAINDMKGNSTLLWDVVDCKPHTSYNYYHAVNSMILSILMGIYAKLDDSKLYDLAVAGLLHDVGTILLPQEILNRPGTLTDEEFNLVRKHVYSSSDLLEQYFHISENARLGTIQHHENYDGSGYPNQLKRKNISVEGRIFSLVDVYDALISKRSYRNSMYPLEALDVIETQSDRKFDPDLVGVLYKVIPPFPTGMSVKLSNGEIGVVMKNHQDHIKRPTIVIPGQGGSKKSEIISLEEHAKDIRIQKLYQYT